MRKLARILITGALVSTTVLLGSWASLALWYRLPVSGLARDLFAGAFALTCIALVTDFVFRKSLFSTIVFAGAFAAVLVWWSTIAPPLAADWSPDVSRQVTGRVAGNRLILADVRNFDWRTDENFTERWETREYDLGKLASVDLFMSHWSGPAIAHMILSFGFEDGKYLAWSVEVRRRRGGEFSPLADLFKSNSLVIIAADERDVVGVRSNVRGEDVQLYRMSVPKEAARQLLLAYVDDANALAAEPRWYNSITTNCTTTVVSMMRALGDAVPFDWRLYLNGYLPDYLYAHAALDTDLPMSRLRELAHIDARAREIGLTEGFSEIIRQGVPQSAPRLKD